MLNKIAENAFRMGEIPYRMRDRKYIDNGSTVVPEQK